MFIVEVNLLMINVEFDAHNIKEDVTFSTRWGRLVGG